MGVIPGAAARQSRASKAHGQGQRKRIEPVQSNLITFLGVDNPSTVDRGNDDGVATQFVQRGENVGRLNIL